MADMVFTSPPYNAGNNHLGGNKKMVSSKYKEGGDQRAASEWLGLLQKTYDSCKSHTQYQFFNIQQLAGNKVALIEFLYQNRDHLCDTAVWAKGKGQPAAAKNVMNSRFEFIYIFSNEDSPPRSIKTASFHGDISNVFEGPGNSANEFSDVHAATFPVHLPSHFINNFSGSGSAIIDPFLGSGTTMIACENLGRKARGCEIDPGYVAVILQRYKDTFPGKEIRLL